MFCQPHRVTSGQSNSGHKQIHISKLFSHIYQPSVKSVYKTNHFANTYIHKHQTQIFKELAPLILPLLKEHTCSPRGTFNTWLKYGRVQSIFFFFELHFLKPYKDRLVSKMKDIIFKYTKLECLPPTTPCFLHFTAELYCHHNWLQTQSRTRHKHNHRHKHVNYRKHCNCIHVHALLCNLSQLHWSWKKYKIHGSQIKNYICRGQSSKHISCFSILCTFQIHVVSASHY